LECAARWLVSNGSCSYPSTDVACAWTVVVRGVLLGLLIRTKEASAVTRPLHRAPPRSSSPRRGATRPTAELLAPPRSNAASPCAIHPLHVLHGARTCPSPRGVYTNPAAHCGASPRCPSALLAALRLAASGTQSGGRDRDHSPGSPLRTVIRPRGRRAGGCRPLPPPHCVGSGQPPRRDRQKGLQFSSFPLRAIQRASEA